MHITSQAIFSTLRLRIFEILASSSTTRVFEPFVPSWAESMNKRPSLLLPNWYALCKCETREKARNCDLCLGEVSLSILGFTISFWIVKKEKGAVLKTLYLTQQNIWNKGSNIFHLKPLCACLWRKRLTLFGILALLYRSKDSLEYAL